MNIPAPIFNRMRFVDQVYLGDLIQMTEPEILRMPGSGQGMLDQVKAELASQRLQLGMHVKAWPPEESRAERLMARDAFVKLSLDEVVELLLNKRSALVPGGSRPIGPDNPVVVVTQNDREIFALTTPDYFGELKSHVVRLALPDWTPQRYRLLQDTLANWRKRLKSRSFNEVLLNDLFNPEPTPELFRLAGQMDPVAIGPLVFIPLRRY